MLRVLLGLGVLWALWRLWRSHAREDTELRLDDFYFASSGTGLGARELRFSPGEDLWLTYLLRGCSVGVWRTCRGIREVQVAPPLELPGIVESEPFHFVKKTPGSFLFYLGRAVLPLDAPKGRYLLTVIVTDELARRTVRKEVAFVVD